MDNRRDTKRRVARYNLDVWDCETDQPIGRLVNLSTNGMRLTCEQPVRIGNSYNLRMELPSVPDDPGLPTGIDVSEQIMFNARSVWCKRKEAKDATDIWDTGLQLTNVPQNTVETIYSALQDALFQY